MDVQEHTLVGATMLLLLGALVVIKKMATGAALEVPRGPLLVRIGNSFNLLFLLIVMPLGTMSWMTGGLEKIDPWHIFIPQGWVAAWQVTAAVFYLAGHALMGWALLTLGRGYQMGGSAPRPTDRLVTRGPYRALRHPMYAAALSICLGLAALTQSGVLFGFFGIYLLLIHRLMALEEEHWLQAGGEAYRAYRGSVKKLIPFVY